MQNRDFGWNIIFPLVSVVMLLIFRTDLLVLTIVTCSSIILGTSLDLRLQKVRNNKTKFTTIQALARDILNNIETGSDEHSEKNQAQSPQELELEEEMDESDFDLDLDLDLDLEEIVIANDSEVPEIPEPTQMQQDISVSTIHNTTSNMSKRNTEGPMQDTGVTNEESITLENRVESHPTHQGNHQNTTQTEAIISTSSSKRHGKTTAEDQTPVTETHSHLVEMEGVVDQEKVDTTVQKEVTENEETKLNELSTDQVEKDQIGTILEKLQDKQRVINYPCPFCDTRQELKTTDIKNNAFKISDLFSEEFYTIKATHLNSEKTEQHIVSIVIDKEGVYRSTTSSWIETLESQTHGEQKVVT